MHTLATTTAAVKDPSTVVHRPPHLSPLRPRCSQAPHTQRAGCCLLLVPLPPLLLGSCDDGSEPVVHRLPGLLRLPHLLLPHLRRTHGTHSTQYKGECCSAVWIRRQQQSPRAAFFLSRDTVGQAPNHFHIKEGGGVHSLQSHTSQHTDNQHTLQATPMLDTHTH